MLKDQRHPSKRAGDVARRIFRQTRSSADGLAKNGAMPSRASLSARLFSSLSAWPLTQRHSTVCRSAAAARARQRSSFLTGFLDAVRQPLLFQLLIQPVTPPRKYWESVCRVTSHERFKELRASIAAVSSMRLLVVSASPPFSSFSWSP